MAVNVAYFWTATTAPDFLNNLVQSGTQANPAIASSPNGARYLATWTDNSAFPDVNLRGRPVDSTGTPVANEFPVNSTVALDQIESSVAALNNSTWVVTFTDESVDAGGDIRFRRFDFNGNPLGNDVEVVVSDPTLDDSRSDVTALADGGFAIAFQRNFGSGDIDLLVRRFNADGTENGNFIIVDQSTLLSTNTPSIAGLASGGFVVAWTQSLTTFGSDTSVWFQRYDAAGAPIGGHVLIDGTDSINRDIQVAALDDGGFAVAYEENSWDPTDRDITSNSTMPTARRAPATCGSTTTTPTTHLKHFPRSRCSRTALSWSAGKRTSST